MILFDFMRTVWWLLSCSIGCTWLVKNLIFWSRLLGNFPPVTWLLIINMFLCTEIEGKTLLFALAEWGHFQVQMNLLKLKGKKMKVAK